MYKLVGVVLLVLIGTAILNPLLGVPLLLALFVLGLIVREARLAPSPADLTGQAGRATVAEADVAAATLTVTLGEQDDVFEVEVVGESRRQDALERIAQGRTESGPVRSRVEAVLVPEPGNRQDQNAIRVEIEGETVGYVGRDDAEDFAPILWKLVQRRQRLVVPATITGGWERRGGADRGRFGVVLDMLDPEDLEGWLSRTS